MYRSNRRAEVWVEIVQGLTSVQEYSTRTAALQKCSTTAVYRRTRRKTQGERLPVCRSCQCCSAWYLPLQKEKLCRIKWKALQNFKKCYKGVQGRFTVLGGKLLMSMIIVVLEYEERCTKTWVRAGKKCTAMAVHEQPKSCKGEGEKLHITVQDRDVCTAVHEC